MTLDDRDLRALLEWLARTAPAEIDCDEFMHRVAAYVERAGSAAARSPEFADVSLHLSVCPECEEEFRALLEISTDGERPEKE